MLHSQKMPSEHPLATQPPTAETVRRMHEMVPQNEGEPMSEADMAASFQRFLDALHARAENCAVFVTVREHGRRLHDNKRVEILALARRRRHHGGFLRELEELRHEP